ncbi:calcium-transporting ATPase 12, plasma membrane-type-like [Olea europaea subsp. europaea]|uniref:Calcium-transporting ATPase 12, plasma membrane-type-like n=1 Tax=Olea europaea subsp. europaea TaxID=158383 RepID=A0A8S0UG69_OLEEU|nr:calcium-transporting ATPase 12, plasma membrane-type-like [Olea europaea subsp. europaea]
MASPQRNPNSTTQNISQSSQEQCHQRDKIHRIIPEKDVNSLGKYGGAPMVAAASNSDIEAGLPTGTALKAGLKQVDPPSFPSFVLEEFKSATLLPLFVSAVICFIAGIVSENPDYGWLEGVDIQVNILILVFLPSIQKYCTARKNAKKIKLLKVTVIRDGEYQDLAVPEVVKGDLVVLKEGDVVPGDGLLVFGNELVIDDRLDFRIDCINNPFLFSGSKVLEGGGRMIVVSTGSSTSLGKMMLLKNRNPFEEEPLFQAHMKELNRTMDYIVMFIYIVLALVLFFQLLYTRNHHKDDQKSVRPPNLNNKVSAEFVETLFKKILLRSRGKIILLIYSLTIVDLGLQGILPPTISASLICWNRNLKKKHQIHHKNLYACGTMGLTKIIVIDVSRELLVPQCPLEAAKDLQDKGVSIVLVSRDDENFVRAISDKIGILPTSRDLVVNGEEFDRGDIPRNNIISIRIMYKSQPKHTFLLVKALRENGHVVAYLGGLATLDTPALKEADVGIIEEHNSCGLADESSDFTVQGKGSLLPLLTSGRFVYSNVGSFIEVLHTTSICILFMAFILEPFHLIWVNAVIHILGFSMILMELPKKRTISLKAKVMCPNIARKVLCQVLLLLSLGFIPKPILGSNEDIQEVMTLNIFTMFQVFYMFQIMEFSDIEVLKVAVRNYRFLVTVGVTIVFHGIIINCTENLSFLNWTVCFLLVLLLWVLDSTLKFVAETLYRLYDQIQFCIAVILVLYFIIL